VLARLGQIDGVESSFANQSGTLVRTSLRPGADPAKVAREVQLVLSEEAGNRDTTRSNAGVPPLGERSANTALREEKWRDSTEVARQAAAGETPGDAPVSRWPGWLLALLVCVALGLALLWLRRGLAKQTTG
jgi:hypothetical protein